MLILKLLIFLNKIKLKKMQKQTPQWPSLFRVQLIKLGQEDMQRKC